MPSRIKMDTENATKNFPFLTSIFEGYTTDYLKQENILNWSKKHVLTGPILMAPAVISSIITADIKQERALNRTEKFVISGSIIFKLQQPSELVPLQQLLLQLTSSPPRRQIESSKRSKLTESRM